MANINKVVPFIQSWEGGFVNNPYDRGGATNKGVTIATFRQHFGRLSTIEDLKNITDEQWSVIFRKGYWDRVKGDYIEDQSIANLLVDWAYNSGAGSAVRAVQKQIGVTADGVMGPITVGAINNCNAEVLFNQLHKRREMFYKGIVEADSSQSVFLKGWLRRLNCIGYNSLKLNF